MNSARVDSGGVPHVLGLIFSSFQRRKLGKAGSHKLLAIAQDSSRTNSVKQSGRLCFLLARGIAEL